ncbi:MAG: amidohydrolase family protein [Chitinophagia bacterium]|jgi:imidazolonepropionase-like amidohydrolase
MQKKNSILILLSLAVFASTASAQENVYPAVAQKGATIITHATIHVGNGTVLNDASVLFVNGKIKAVGNSVTAPSDATVVDATGKQVYPGLILPVSSLGLKEINSGVRGSNDFQEIGENNASIRSIVSYNTDSKITNVLRSNGVLLAHVAPLGDLIEGSSSVVQLDAWNYEDAAYKSDIGMFINMPSLMARRGRGGFMRPQASDPSKIAFEKIEVLKKFFTDAKAYLDEKNHASNNLKFEAVRGLYSGKQKLFIRANEVKQMLLAIDLGKTFGFNIVLVGAVESLQIASVLAENKIPVILDNQHALPTTEDDDIDQLYKLPAQLKKAGVMFAINDANDQAKQRNIGFNAGTAAAYGLDKEEALSAITLNTAKILGLDDITGSIETGKDANIIISEGDILDMRGNQVSRAFIQGRDISLDSKQKQLYERYKYKYKIK